MFPYRRLPSHITGLYIFTVINLFILCHLALVQADISVISLKTNETVVPFIPDMPAYFGGHISYEGIWGQTVYSEPATGCMDIQPPPKNFTIGIPGSKWFVLIKRNDCSFSRKVLNAQNAGYDAAIIHNVGSNSLEPMGPDKEKGIIIPSVFIGESDGLSIKNSFTYEKGFIMQISPDLPFNLNPYILPFAVGVGACLFIMCLVMVVKCVRDRNRQQRHRLPHRLLKQLPIRKFKKNDPYDMCAICLEEYIEGEKLRVLPCNHTYHTKCIDPWLTESRRTCPVCKRKVLPRNRRGRRGLLSSMSGSESDSDSEHESENGQASEHTPLLVPGSRGNINVLERDVGHSNQGLVYDDDSDAESGATATPTLPRSLHDVPSTSSSPGGGRYQSLATSYGSSPSLNGMRLVVPANELLSSGEHSVNGDLYDFVPVETLVPDDDGQSAGASRGPVEIAIDVATRETMSSIWNTSPNNSKKTNCDLVV